MNKQKKKLLFLISILFLAGALRFYQISLHDCYTDEGILAFRSIGLIDYNTAVHQTTPWQWVDDVPGWMHLSMHDHPIFFFLIQHASISIFGENMLGMRIPAVLAGILSVFLLYLVGKKLFNQKIGLLAAALLSVQSYHIWVSRLGIQDGMVLMFSLLILWLWLEALEKEKWWLWLLWGLSLGLGIITKYTILIIIPILAVHALIYKYKFYKNKLFWLGSITTFIICSPSWIYNILLYKKFGHFDFQISAMLGQEVGEWVVRQGREMTGGFFDRIKFFFAALNQANSKLFNFFISLSLFASFFFIAKRHSKVLFFLASAIILQTLWFLAIGSTLRFVVMIIPYFVLLLGFIFTKLIKCKKIGYTVLILFIFAELLFSTNSFFLSSPWGKKNIAFAEINKETQHFGFNELDKYLDNFLENKSSAVLGQPKYKFIADLHRKEIKKEENKDYKKFPLIIIYDKDFNSISGLWVFQRRLIYYSWPAISDETFFENTKGTWDEYYRRQGVDNFLYVTGVKDVNFDIEDDYQPFAPKQQETKLEKYLISRSIEPEYIQNIQGKDIFAIYKF